MDTKSFKEGVLKGIVIVGEPAITGSKELERKTVKTPKEPVSEEVVYDVTIQIIGTDGYSSENKFYKIDFETLRKALKLLKERGDE